jgi:hypothetical protein
VREYLLEIHFDTPNVPEQCWQYARVGTGELTDRRDLVVDNADGVHAVALDFGPGVFGIAWS